MKKIFITLLVIAIFSFVNFTPVFAEGETTLPAPTEEVILPSGEIDNGESQEEMTADSKDSEEKNSEDFLTGTAVGASFGFIAGAVIAWLFKDKIFS